MKKLHSAKTSLTALTISVLLAACGGGGVESTTSSALAPVVSAPAVPPVAPPTVPAPVVPAAPADSMIQTQVLAATYASGTEQRNAYDYLNAQRLHCGFGLLQQDSKLDVAAQGHANYLTVNNLLPGHYQDQTRFPLGFTGNTINDRTTAAGYMATFGDEVIAGAEMKYGSSLGQSGIMDLFTTPYHGNGLLYANRDIGIGFGKYMVVEFGTTTARPKQQIPANQVLTYPCEGTTGVLSKSYVDENPAPIAGRNLQSNPIGHPIYVKVSEGNTLVLSSYILRKTGTSVDLALQLLNKATDTTKTITDDATAIVMPLAPLERNASYLFAASGTNNGNPISVTFTFTTGSY